VVLKTHAENAERSRLPESLGAVYQMPGSWPCLLIELNRLLIAVQPVLVVFQIDIKGEREQREAQNHRDAKAKAEQVVTDLFYIKGSEHFISSFPRGVSRVAGREARITVYRHF
jgi:hypothetical protein